MTAITLYGNRAVKVNKIKLMKDYSIELLAALIGDLIAFEDDYYENWTDVEIEFEKCTAVVSGTMYAADTFTTDCELYKVELYKVELQFEDSETIFNKDEIEGLEKLIMLYK